MVLLSALLALTAAAAPPEPVAVELVTVGPGPAYWERFGHNAILVRYAGAAPPVSYNYGIFDFGQRNFLLNFVRGRMTYRLAGLDPERELAAYRAADRSIVVQTLNLSRAEMRQLAAFLEHNRRPENASYRYDYFTANCSTKVRDALDLALGGALATRFGDEATSHTFRGFTNRYAAPVKWMYVGTQLALGRPTDREISRWETFFIPEELRRGLDLAMVDDGNGRARKLVTATRVLNRSERYQVPQEPPRWTHLFLLAGLVGGAGILLAGKRLKRWLAAGWWGACALLGALMLLVWVATDHTAAYENENLLIFSPLALPGVLALLRKHPARGTARTAAGLILIPALAALALPASGLLYQHNAELIALGLPLHAAAGAVLLRAAAGR